jgi:hypothetical protein
MCYPKPGPRCSSHALLALTTEKMELSNLYSKEGRDITKVLKQLKKIEKLEEVYDTTPAGLQELEERLALTSSTDKIKTFQLQSRLTTMTKRRENQLKALKKAQRDAGEISHEATAFVEYGDQDFPTILTSVPNDSPRITNLLNDSTNWVNTLTPEEVKATRWYTKGGYQEIYSFQQFNEIAVEGRTKEQLNSYIQNINTALAKYKREEPIIVYRGVGMVGNNTRLSTDEASVFFKTGDEYSYESYSSTSMDSSIAGKFSSSNIVLALKTKKAVPVTSLSQHGLGEKELIIPPKQKFKVTNVVPNKYGVTIVHMEELD